jgi:hypothetical protein
MLFSLPLSRGVYKILVASGYLRLPFGSYKSFWEQDHFCVHFSNWIAIAQPVMLAEQLRLLSR